MTEPTPTPLAVTIRCRLDGPLLVEGPVRILDHLGNAFVLPTGKPAVALCRCGQSSKKPFCDGTHKQCGFKADQTALPPEPPQPPSS